VVCLAVSSVEGKRGRGGNFLCPRCGSFGYVERRSKGGHVYVYCVHVYRDGGRRRRKRCYLGAEEYDYVERFQELGLAGLTDRERFRRYMRSLLEKLGDEDLKWIVEEAKQRLEVLKARESGGGSA